MNSITWAAIGVLSLDTRRNEPLGSLGHFVALTVRTTSRMSRWHRACPWPVADPLQSGCSRCLRTILRQPAAERYLVRSRYSPTQVDGSAPVARTAAGPLIAAIELCPTPGVPSADGVWRNAPGIQLDRAAGAWRTRAEATLGSGDPPCAGAARARATRRSRAREADTRKHGAWSLRPSQGVNCPEKLSLVPWHPPWFCARPRARGGGEVP